MFAFLSRISFTLLVILMTISIYMIFNYAPKEKIMGDVQRIFYFHMGSVLVFTLAFIARAAGRTEQARGPGRSMGAAS